MTARYLAEELRDRHSTARGYQLWLKKRIKPKWGEYPLQQIKPLVVVPLPVLQQQMRHADIKTTLRSYAHAIPASQREAMERLANRTISTVVPIGTESLPN